MERSLQVERYGADKCTNGVLLPEFQIEMSHFYLTLTYYMSNLIFWA